MKTVSLVVDLATPTLVGGAEPGRCDDPSGLRPPSLRGHLRFWSRALGGRALEESLWGTEDRGQRVRIISSRAVDPHGYGELVEYPILPHRSGGARGVLRMLPPGAGKGTLLRFGVPEEEGLVPKLQAVVWTWLQLGGIGRRSRRGYGSLLWRPSQGDLLAGFGNGLELWSSHHLRTVDTLAGYLRAGLARVREILRSPGENPRTAQEEEILASQDQVFIGELQGVWEEERVPLAQDQESIQFAIKGLNPDHRGTGIDRDQLGYALREQRRPSPILWRLYPVSRGRHLVAVTWFPAGYPAGSTPRLERSGPVYGYLHRHFGVEKSLTNEDLAS